MKNLRAITLIVSFGFNLPAIVSIDQKALRNEADMPECRQGGQFCPKSPRKNGEEAVSKRANIALSEHTI